MLTPLLDVVAVQGGPGYLVCSRFDKPHYKPVLRKHFFDIHISFAMIKANLFSMKRERISWLYIWEERNYLFKFGIESTLHSFTHSNMRVKHCCDSKAYQYYYLNQIGNGGPYFSGVFQNGYDLDGIFSNLAKSIMPLIKSGAKTIGKQALKGGLGLASYVLAGKDAKKAAVERAKRAGSSLLQQAAGRKCKAPARAQKEWRKQTNDIFS